MQGTNDVGNAGGGHDMIKCEVTILNAFSKQLTCPTRQLIPDAVQNCHKAVVGGHARTIW